MRKFVGRVLALIGALTLGLIVLVFVVATFARSGKGTVPGKTVLELRLEGPLRETEPEDPLAKLLGKDQPVLRDVIEALEKGRDDSRVVGLIATLGAAPMSMAEVQELRDAIQNFRSAKKFAVAFSETFGEFGPGNGAYYLATAFDEIYLQPSGDVGLTGLRAEGMFLRGALDKLGAVPQFGKRYEYKSAAEMYTEKQFTAPARESMDVLLGSIYGQLAKGIAAGRKLDEGATLKLAGSGPYLGEEAVRQHLVNGLAYRDEVYDRVKARVEGSQLLFVDKYLERVGRPHTKGPVVALIHGVGPVMRGASDFNPFEGDTTMGSDTVTRAFRDAIKDKDVKAILFRVDSPGGSAVASDSIWRETQNAKRAGKPVIVSMGGVAASGGYYVAMGADKIVAQPATITGSIGVLGGKVVTRESFGKLGITFDSVEKGDHAGMFSANQEFKPEEWERFNASLDRIYQEFIMKVAEGRKMTKEKVHEMAKGRVWTGEDAKRLGLVDELGGYPVALKLVKQAIKAEGDVTLRQYPKKKTTLEAVMAQLNGDERDSSEVAAAAMLRHMVKLRPVVKALETVQPQRAVDPNVLALPMMRLTP
ncbi:MAG: signal peptide peptidase SppA [Bryobacterales bacterium]|nr:signal peptide peptidase SppA [Bryobacterales bacterium]